MVTVVKLLVETRDEFCAGMMVVNVVWSDEMDKTEGDSDERPEEVLGLDERFVCVGWIIDGSITTESVDSATETVTVKLSTFVVVVVESIAIELLRNGVDAVVLEKDSVSTSEETRSVAEATSDVSRLEAISVKVVLSVSVAVPVTKSETMADEVEVEGKSVAVLNDTVPFRLAESEAISVPANTRVLEREEVLLQVVESWLSDIPVAPSRAVSITYDEVGAVRWAVERTSELVVLPALALESADIIAVSVSSPEEMEKEELPEAAVPFRE